jgi:hypothetical protein
MRPQRSWGGLCFPFTAEELSTSQGLLVTKKKKKNAPTEIIQVPASKEPQLFGAER